MSRDTPNTDAERRYISLWKSFGGSQHGPINEQVTMPYERFFEFMAGFEKDTRGKCANIADAEADEARAFFKAEPCESYATGILVASGIAKKIRSV